MKKDNKIFDLEDIDIYKYNEYKDYVILPYVDEEEIYDMFLDTYKYDSKYLKNIKEKLHKEGNFCVNFRRFIDSNEKFNHSLSDIYFDFEIGYLKPIMIEWCNKNKIAFVDDTHILSFR